MVVLTVERVAKVRGGRVEGLGSTWVGGRWRVRRGGRVVVNIWAAFEEERRVRRGRSGRRIVVLSGGEDGVVE